MKIALDWIGEYLSPVPAAAVAADALMNAGLPVESVSEAPGVKGPTQVLDVEVTSNRTDCFSHVGLARELSALCGGNFALPKVVVQEVALVGGSDGAPTLTSVDVQDAAGCPYYSARIVRGVKVGPSPEWLKKRLEAIGLRPINNVVDVTNYVLMELGQPLHAFDFDVLEGKRIVVRRAGTGEKREKMKAIDGREYSLEPAMLVIADAVKPVAIAGVMGGKATEVTEKTTTILLESARFEPLTIRTTSRALGLKSDSSYRFERGIDPAMAEMASRRAAQLILQVAGGELVPGMVSVGTAKSHALQVDMRFKRFHDVMGISVSHDRAMGILCGLGFSAWLNEKEAGEEDDVLSVRIPSHRMDVDREIDLIEEVARVHGYHHVPALDRVSHAVKPEPVMEKAGRTIRSAMVEAGYSEAIGLSFISEADAEQFLPADGRVIKPVHAGWRGDVLRPSLLPSLLKARRTNQDAGILDGSLFEMAQTFVGRPGASPKDQMTLAFVGNDAGHIRGTIDLLLGQLNPDVTLSVEVKNHAMYLDGVSASCRLNPSRRELGSFGQIHPAIQKAYGLRLPVFATELHAEVLLELFQPVRQARPVPRFPGVKRDLSVVMEEAVRWVDVEAAIAGAQLAYLERVDFVTTFRSSQVGTGKKSLTLALDFRDPARTLKSEEVDTQMATALETLTRKFGAVLRA